jgi:hypothetical protein
MSHGPGWLVTSRLPQIDTPPPLRKCREVQGHHIPHKRLENFKPYARIIRDGDSTQHLLGQHGLMCTVWDALS